MFKDFLDKFVGDWEPIPNRFTIVMGKLIRKARTELDLSQADLAKSIFVRQASISDIENGKREIKASELLYLSLTLRKPISYFFPKDYLARFDGEKLSPLQQELVLLSYLLSDDDLKKIIAQTKAITELE